MVLNHLFINLSAAADISVQKRNIVIQGEIQKGDFEAFVNAALVAGSNTSTVFIASKGGDASESIRIGKLIRALHFTTTVRSTHQKLAEFECSSNGVTSENCTCTSSCLLLYLSGIFRNGEYIGVHRVFVNHDNLKSLTLGSAKKHSSIIKEMVDDYITEMGAPDSLSNLINNVPSDNIEFLKEDYISKYLNGLSIGYQEWIYSKCGNGLAMAKLYKHTEMMSIIECQENLLKTERAKSFYPVIYQAMLNSDKIFVPLRSLMEYLLKLKNLDLSTLIGKKNMEAFDLLSITGIPNKYSTEEINEFVNKTFFINNKELMIGFDKQGYVYKVGISFFASPISKIYERRFLNNLDRFSKPSDFIKIYGAPEKESACYKGGVCFLLFKNASIGLQVIFNDDKSLRAIDIYTNSSYTALFE